MRYKTKKKIKYFLRCNLKRLIRCIIYFGLFVALTFNCFAISNSRYYYNTFSDFLYSGSGVEPVVTSYISPFVNPDYQQFTGYKNVTLNSLDNGVVFDRTDDIYSFYSIKLEINGSLDCGPAFSSAKKGDVFLLEQYFRIDVSMIENYNEPPDVENFTLELILYNDDGSHNYYFKGSKYFKILRSYANEANDFVEYDIRLLIDNFTIPFDCYIGDYSYYFNGLSTTYGTYKVAFYSPSEFLNSPDNAGSILFYIGNYENSPSFTAPNNDSFNDFSDAESGLLDDTNADDELNTIFSGFESAIESLDVGFTILREMIYPILRWPPFSTILFISLCIGIFALLLNLANSFRRD